MKTTKKILIAHHDAGMRRRLVMLFAAAGFDVRSFVSPDAVLEGARAEWFDLALIDGDGAGSALATGLREIQPTVQLLLMVPKMDLGMVVQGIRQGAAEVVVLTDDPMPVLRQALAFFHLEAPEGLDAGEVAALEARAAETEAADQPGSTVGLEARLLHLIRQNEDLTARVGRLQGEKGGLEAELRTLLAQAADAHRLQGDLEHVREERELATLYSPLMASIWAYLSAADRKSTRLNSSH